MQKIFKTALYLVSGGEIAALIFLALFQSSAQAFITINVGMVIGVIIGISGVICSDIREGKERRKEIQKEYQRQMEVHKEIARLTRLRGGR